MWSCGMRLLFSAGKISFLIEEEERKIEWLVVVRIGERVFLFRLFAVRVTNF